MPHRRNQPEFESPSNSAHSARRQAPLERQLPMVSAEHRAVLRALGSLRSQIHVVAPRTGRLVQPSISNLLDLILRNYMLTNPSWAHAIGSDRLNGWMPGERDTCTVELSHFAHAALSTHFHEECAHRGVDPSARGWADTVAGVYIDALIDDHTMALIRRCRP